MKTITGYTYPIGHLLLLALGLRSKVEDLERQDSNVSKRLLIKTPRVTAS